MSELIDLDEIDRESEKYKGKKKGDYNPGRMASDKKPDSVPPVDWQSLAVGQKVTVTFTGTVVQVLLKGRPFPSVLIRSEEGLKQFYPGREAVVFLAETIPSE